MRRRATFCKWKVAQPSRAERGQEHGTGFELVYTISNTFRNPLVGQEYARNHGSTGRVSCVQILNFWRQRNEYLGQSEDSDDDALVGPFDFEDNPEDYRGVCSRRIGGQNPTQKSVRGQRGHLQQFYVSGMGTNTRRICLVS